MQRNIRLYPWFQACRSLMFWQAVWFLYFQDVLSAREAIVLAVTYDIATSLLEVPSGYISDRYGRRITLMLALVATIVGCLLIAGGESFLWFVAGQVLIGVGTAFTSGTDSSLLYDSLLSERREGEVAAQEVRAWRFMFTASALAAFVGGVLSAESAKWAFAATAASACAALAIVAMFSEPLRSAGAPHAAPVAEQARRVLHYFRNPALTWIFALAVAMYVFSHVPFTLGQPFIHEMMLKAGLETETTLVSGSVTALMMLISVGAGWSVMPLARRLGNAGILLFAFAMQIALIAVLAASTHPAAVAFLLLRMVPDACSKPFILAGVQPRLDSAHRATYLSLQSLCGRVVLAGSLLFASSLLEGEGLMSEATLHVMLACYAGLGLVVWISLKATAKVLDVPPDPVERAEG